MAANVFISSVGEDGIPKGFVWQSPEGSFRQKLE